MIYDDTRPETIRSTIYLSTLVLVVGFVVLNAFLPNSDVNLVVGVLQATMATMVLCYYIMAAIRAVVTGSSANTDFLIVGIVLSWISTDGQAILALLARLSNFSPTLMNSELFAPLKLLSVIAAILHVVPKGAANGVVPQGNKAAVGGFLILAAILATALVTTKPDPTYLIDRAPTWMRDFWQTGALQTTEEPPA